MIDYKIKIGTVREKGTPLGGVRPLQKEHAELYNPSLMAATEARL